MALTTIFNSANKMIAIRNITNKIITTIDMICKKTKSTRAKRPPQITMFKTWDSNLLCRCSIDQTEMMILPPTRKTWGESPLIIQTVSGGFIKILPRQNSDNENKIRWRNHVQLAQLWSLNPQGCEWFHWSLKKREGTNPGCRLNFEKVIKEYVPFPCCFFRC